jgi:UDP-glucose 4-epimerase
MAQIKNSTCLITGGAGFVGSHLAEELLLHHPKKVVLLDNLARGSLANIEKALLDKRVEFVQGDVRDADLLDKLMAKSDLCFHMAALRINACAANPEEGYQVMVKGVFNVAESARRHSIKKLIYCSSASIYGLAQHFPTPETDHPYDNQTFYGAAKLFGEQLLRSYCHLYGLKYTALRYFNIYGPRMDREGKYTEVMIKWLDCIREKKAPVIMGKGATSMDFVYVKDVARANALAALADTCDTVYNIGSGRETSLKELLHLMLKVNKSKLAPEYRPENVVNPVSRRLADIRKAKKELGFKVTVALEEGIKNLSKWYFKS